MDLRLHSAKLRLSSRRHCAEQGIGKYCYANLARGFARRQKKRNSAPDQATIKGCRAAADNLGVTGPAPHLAPVSAPEPAASSGPLTADHLLQLEAARVAAKRVRRAVSVARGDGWTVAGFGAVTFLCGLGTVSGALVGSGMMVIAFIELQAANRLRRLETGAARVLGLNQLALAGLLLAYAVVGIYSVLYGPSEYAAAVASEPELGRALGPIEDLTKTLALAVYAVVMLVAVFFQGGMAMYYFGRATHVRAYLAQTPPWVIAVQRAGRFI
jgi:hypothetical protein